jgi:hypothetical protein
MNVRPMRRLSRRLFRGPSWAARVVGAGALAILFAWAAPLLGADGPPNGDSQAGPPRIFNKGRNFRIPFKLNPEGRARVKELHLLVSEDMGYHWRAVSKTFPDHPTFTFRAAHDGEYWFAVQILTIDGKVSPPMDATVEPNMKVVVDIFPPSLLLEQDVRRGSRAAVRWEVRDENLDLKTFVLEYQVDGAPSWRRVPIKRVRTTGSQEWDAGTAEALKVRASVADRAANVTEAIVDLPEGTGSEPDISAGSEPGELTPPAISAISSGPQPQITAGPDFTPVDSERSARRANAQPISRPSRTSRGARSPAVAPSREVGSSGNVARGSGPGDGAAPAVDLLSAPGNGAFATVPAFGSLAASGPVSSPPATPGDSPGGRDGKGQTLLVASPKFKLQYAVDDAGPDGPATLELWLTQDGGRTWIRRGDDPDRASPIEVDLGGEGTYGLCLVARSASGLGDLPPAPGDPPQSWVEVDTTPPAVQLMPPQVGTGTNSGKVAIAWRASDLHLPPKSVSLSWRPDQPGADWQPLANGQDNVGQFVWSVPMNVPPRFHIRVEAVDSVGHHGSAETTESGPISVDRSRPRSRIIGLEQGSRAGAGTSARIVQ